MNEPIDVNAMFRPRVRRLVATVRAGFALFSLAALTLAEPERYVSAAWWLLLAYAAYATAVAAVRRRTGFVEGRWDHLLIGIDVAVLGALMFLTGGSTSPFFVWLNFVLVAVMLTRGWREVAAVTLLLLALYALSALAFVETRGGGQPFELQRFLIRAGYLLAGGLLLTGGARAQEQVNLALARVFGWAGPEAARPAAPPLEQALAHATDVLGADVAALVWEDEEEPGADLARYDGHALMRRRLGPDALGDRRDRRFAPGQAGRAAAPAAADLPPDAAVLRYAVAEDGTDGVLFLARAAPFLPEEFRLGRLLAAQVAAGLGRTAALDALAEARAVEERVRVAQDLHDGILQTLAGTALHLRSMIDDHPDLDGGLRGRIGRLQALLVDEQRQLRGFIQRLRPRRILPPMPAPLGPELDALARRIEGRWRIAVDCVVEPVDLALPEPIRFELEQIVQEAAANAVRHGGASSVSVTVARDGPVLNVAIGDDGRGLPAHGRFGAEMVKSEELGSRSLGGRVERLGGAMALDSSAEGLHVAIRLPIGG